MVSESFTFSNILTCPRSVLCHFVHNVFCFPVLHVDIIIVFYKGFDIFLQYHFKLRPSKWFSPSVRPSVRPSVCLSVSLSVCPSHLFQYIPIIMKFSRVVNNDRIDVHAKVQGHRLKFKVTEVKTQHNRFRTVAYDDEMKYSGGGGGIVFQGHPSNFKVTRPKIYRVRPKVGVSGL